MRNVKIFKNKTANNLVITLARHQLCSNYDLVMCNVLMNVYICLCCVLLYVQWMYYGCVWCVLWMFIDLLSDVLVM